MRSGEVIDVAQQYDWMVVPDKASVKDVVPGQAFSYDLVNMTVSEALVYQRRDWGINLGFGDPAASSNIRFQRKGGGTAPLKFGEVVAIGVRGGRWLYYQVRDWGVNLGWSDVPKFEWRLDDPENRGARAVPVLGLVGLYNVVQKDQLMYERRDWGVNLKWFKDAGEYDTWGDLKDLADKIKDIKEKAAEWIG